LDKLPVHMDLPRFIKKIEVGKRGKRIWPESDFSSSGTSNLTDEKREQLVLSFIVTLSTLLEGEERGKEIKSKFDQHFVSKEETDLSKRLLKFLQEVVGEDSKTLKVLKACTQTMVSYPFTRLKFVIANQFPHKGITGSWRLLLLFNKDDIRVRHIKWEQSSEKSVNWGFTFKWEYEMVFDTEMKNVVDVSMKITDLLFQNCPPDKKDALEKAMVSSGWYKKPNSNPKY